MFSACTAQATVTSVLLGVSLSSIWRHFFLFFHLLGITYVFIHFFNTVNWRWREKRTSLRMGSKVQTNHHAIQHHLDCNVILNLLHIPF